MINLKTKQKNKRKKTNERNSFLKANQNQKRTTWIENANEGV